MSVGDTLEYTVTATNDGPTKLTNVTVSDDLTGDIEICPGPLLPGATCILTTYYVVTMADLVNGTILNVGRAVSDQTEPVVTGLNEQTTDPVEDIVEVEVSTTEFGQLTPTGTTCDDYVGSSALDFREFYSSQGGVIEYQVKKNVIFQTNPNVFFYYTGLSKSITDEGKVFIKQSVNPIDGMMDGGWFDPAKNDVKLWLVTGGTCTQASASVDDIKIENGDVTVTISESLLPEDDSYYVISVKYDTGSVKGKVVTDSDSVHYTFSTNVGYSVDVGYNGHFAETDGSGITLGPKSKRKLRVRA